MWGRFKSNISFSSKREEKTEDVNVNESRSFKASTHNLLIGYLGHLAFSLETEEEQQQEREYKYSLVMTALKEIKKSVSLEQVKESLSKMLTIYAEYKKKNNTQIEETDGMNEISKHLVKLQEGDMLMKNKVEIPKAGFKA